MIEFGFNLGIFTMNIVCLKTLINFISAIAAFVAAGLWLKASTVTIKPSKDMKGGGLLVVNRETKESFDLINTGIEQSKWNKYAAIAACIAALFQGIGLLIP